MNLGRKRCCDDPFHCPVPGDEFEDAEHNYMKITSIAPAGMGFNVIAEHSLYGKMTILAPLSRWRRNNGLKLKHSVPAGQRHLLLGGKS